MNKPLKLGSLFDGSGGFPLAGILSGIEPVWASEVEPFPIRVTTRRLPDMKHYGDVRTLSGRELEPVDIITFGSPCQDMSVAGRRDGLDGSRSGLFYEAIRIAGEMREETHELYPRFLVWENVPGAFSSNGGADFKAVLEAIIGLREENVQVPEPEKGRWPAADILMGPGWSVAYRVLDAQYWGVPQRRARIFLVADLDGECAGEILFKSEGLSGYSPESFDAWKKAATGTEGSVGKADGVFLNTSHADKGIAESDICATLLSRDFKGGKCVFTKEPTMIEMTSTKNTVIENGISSTITARMGTGGNQVNAVCVGNGQTNNLSMKPVSNTLDTMDDPQKVMINQSVIRRLTPTECARLQGFPDWWSGNLETPEPTEEDISFWADVFETYRIAVTKTNRPRTRNQIVKWLKNPHNDSAEYKMWGNGVALPCVWFVLAGIAWVVEKDNAKSV